MILEVLLTAVCSAKVHATLPRRIWWISTTWFGRLYQILTIRAENSAFVDHK